MSGQPRTKVLAVTEIKDECFVVGCESEVESVVVYDSTLHRDVVAMWLCRLHGEVFQLDPPSDADSSNDVQVQETSRTCRRRSSSGAACGAYATHAIVFGALYADGRRKLRVISACERHAAKAI